MTDGLKGYIDEDSDDSFLDLPLPTYQGGKPMSSEYLAQRADPEYRRKHGLGPLPKLPAPIER